jgi:hypothetical protein
MPQVVRVYRGQLHGRTPLSGTGRDMHRGSSVPSSARERRSDTNRVTQDRGDAGFVVEVDWEDALPVCTDITLLDSLPVQVVHLGGAGDR